MWIDLWNSFERLSTPRLMAGEAPIHTDEWKRSADTCV